MVAASPNDQLLDLLGALCNGTITTEDEERLGSLLGSDRDARQLYVRYLDLHLALTDLDLTVHTESDEALPGLLAGLDSYERDNSHSFNVLYDEQRQSPPALSFFSTTLPGTAGFFSSGWPVAYLVATVIFGLGLLIGSLMPVSEPEQVARPSAPLPSHLSPLPSIVGRITGMVDCRWAENPKSEIRNHQSEIRNPDSLVALGDKFVLASGLMEITYDTGAKVILQGPVTYEVESPSAGFLSVGKLTTRVESGEWRVDSKSPNLQVSKSPNSSLSTNHYPLFTIKTPTATVTDLGTEFGVEVGKGGKVEVHVLQGAVTVQQSAHKDGTPKPMRVTQGQAVQIEPNRAVFTAVAYVPSAFVRSIGARRDGNSSPRSGGAYSRAVLSDHPVAYYRLNETAGHTAYDLANTSGREARGDFDAIYVNFGTGVGAGNLGQAGPRPTDLVEGRPLLGFESNSRAPDFRPSMLTRVQRANRGTGDALNVTGALSMEAWVCVDRYSVSNQGIVSKWWSGEEGKDIAQRSYCLLIDNQSPGRLHAAGFVVSSDGAAAGATAVHGSQAVPIGQWVHLAATFVPGKSLRVYCNGALQAVRTADVPAAIFDSAAPLWIGAHHDRTNSAVYFSGRIAEAAIYNYALDDVNGRGTLDADNRVTAHYNAAFKAGGEAPPTVSRQMMPSQLTVESCTPVWKTNCWYYWFNSFCEENVR